MGCDSSYMHGSPTSSEIWFAENFGSHEDLLCSICSAVERGDAVQMLKCNSPIAAWWKWHKKKDRARLAEEEADRERALLVANAKNKLTKEEREALGIRD